MFKSIQIFSTLVLLILLGCTKHGEPSEVGTTKQKYVIIIKPMEHPSLEACIEGFENGLREKGYSDDALKFEVLNANGNFANVPSLAKTAVAKKPDLIFTVTTPAASSAIRITDQKVPLVYSAVTDPVKSGVVSSMRQSTTMATGTTDRYPVKAQVKLFCALVPRAKNFAILRSQNEQNSEILGAETKAELQGRGLAVHEYVITSAADIPVVVKRAIANDDCLIVNGDNLLIENLQAILRLCNEAKRPLLVGDPDSVRKGAIATVGPSYSAIGRAAGRKAALVLSGTMVGDIPSDDPSAFDYIINFEAATAIGLDLPKELWNMGQVWESHTEPPSK